MRYERLSTDSAALLLVDHQVGLLSLVRDHSPDEFKNAVLALAAVGRYFELPTVLTTSFDRGPNGPILPELREMLPDVPFIARTVCGCDSDRVVRGVWRWSAGGRRQSHRRVLAERRPPHSMGRS